MKLNNEFTVDVPVEDVWNVLLDLEGRVPWVVIGCRSLLGVSQAATHPAPPIPTQHLQPDSERHQAKEVLEQVLPRGDRFRPASSELQAGSSHAQHT